MSTSSVSSTTSSTSTGYQLTSLGTNSPEQITGLASGLDTNSIVTELMQVAQAPVTALQNQVTGLTTENTQLTSIQTALQSLASDAQALGNPSLFDTSQNVTSSNSTQVSGTSSTGAAIGGYQVSVTQLANSAQRTFSYTSPTSATTMTIDGQSVTVGAGESASSVVDSINSNSNLDVYAAATDSGTIVMSNRSTGDTGSNYIQVSGASGMLTEQTALAKEGVNAEFSVDDTSGTSESNTVTNAIAGVSLNLSGVTTTTGPVTVEVSPPAANSANVESAVNTFVTQYNSVISQIQTQLSQAPSSSDPTQGTLYDDQDLSGLLSSMRDALVTSMHGLPSGMSNMNDIGVNTGATTGSGAVSQSSLSGNLTADSSTLSSALESNPSGVQSLLNSFSIQFSELVNNEAAPGGTIGSRIQGDDSNMSELNSQISNMQTMLTDKQTQLTDQFAQMEAALSQNQSTASWLTSQIAQLP
jgi:flagellar hook-associated protein 2